MRRPQKSNHVDVHIGKQMQSGRKLRGMSQVELGKQLCLTAQQVQKYETGLNRISAGHLWKVAKVLDVPVSSFFEGLNRNESAATEALVNNAVQQLVNDVGVSPEPVKSATSLLLKSMAEGAKPRRRKRAK